MPQNPYDQVAYPSFPRRHTHPDRLGAVAKLFGMQPAPVTECRVLEIGSGDGSNLISMAYALPGSVFTGVDLAPEPVAAARRQAETLGLENLRFHECDLREIGPEFGEFDYIVAHGVYSWVPPEVRDGLLAVCRARLAPNGVAFVSYNVYPGRYIRHILRDMMMYHTRRTPEGTQKVEEAKEFLHFLSTASKDEDRWQAMFGVELQYLLDQEGGAIYHDDLAPVNDPVYFWQFAEHAARHGLQYVGDAEVQQMFDQRERLNGLELDLPEQEQYLDFLKLRGIRHTILCGEEVRLNRQLSPEQMDEFLFSAPAQLEAGQWKGAQGIMLSSGDEDVNRVTQAIGDTWPLPVSFDDLLPYASSPQVLRRMLYGMVTHGFLAPHVFDFPCQETVSERPRASRLARLHASAGQPVANLCHGVVEMDEIGRRLLILLDGMRDHAAVARDLAATSGGPPLAEVERHLTSSLQWMARMALLEA